jgi:fucose permease
MRLNGRTAVPLSYATFVLIGITAGGNGVLLLAQMSDYGVDRTTIGLTFFTGTVGFVLGGLATGALVHRIGIRTTLAIGGAANTLAGLYMATRPSFAALVVVQVVTGFASGVLESALTVYLAELPGATTKLNRLHAFFGVGALIGPVLAARIVAVSNWRVVWLVIAAAYVPLIAGFLLAHPGRHPAEAAAGAATQADAADEAAPHAAWGLLRAAVRDPGVLFGAVMLSVYVGLELGVGSWGFAYLVQTRSLSESAAGYGVSGYWLGLTLGRFLISPVAAKIGVTTAAMIYACLAGIVAAATLAWLAPGAVAASVALVLLGFFLGPIFPTTMAIVPQVAGTRLAPTAIGVMNAASAVGGAALPWLAGAIGQSAGTWTLLPFTVSLGLVLFAAWRPLANRIRTPAVVSSVPAS